MTTGSERRAERRRRVERRARRRRYYRIAAVVVPVVVAAGLVAYVRTRPDPRAGAAVVEGASIEVASRTPPGYSIVYRVEDRAAGEVVVTTQRLTVRRPTDSFLETLKGPPPGGEVLSSQVFTVGRFALGQPGAEPTVLAVPPGTASEDVRLGSYLEDVIDAGLAQPREHRRVVGRICRVFRFGRTTAGTAALRAPDRDAEINVESCLDEAGLMLERVEFDGDRMARRSIAVSVDESPQIQADAFEVGAPTVPADQGGGAVRSLELSSRAPGRFLELGRLPPGFEHSGRYSVVPPQSGLGDPLAQSRIVASVADLLVRGSDLIVVERGGTREGAVPFTDDPGAEPVDLGELGSGELFYTIERVEVRVKTGGGRFVRVYGTARPDVLIAVAKDLREVEGGELVPMDELPA